MKFVLILSLFFASANILAQSDAKKTTSIVLYMSNDGSIAVVESTAFVTRSESVSGLSHKYKLKGTTATIKTNTNPTFHIGYVTPNEDDRKSYAKLVKFEVGKKNRTFKVTESVINPGKVTGATVIPTEKVVNAQKGYNISYSNLSPGEYCIVLSKDKLHKMKVKKLYAFTVE